jgi:hypothetical protein
MPSGEYVGVSVKLMPTGEARYHQAWFQATKPMTRPTRTIGLLILVMLGIFAASALAGQTLFAPGVLTTPSPISANDGLPGSAKGDPPAKDVPPDMRLTKLKNELESSRDVRDKLKGYLAQEGFAADTSKLVVDERRSVKLIADLDKAPPPLESIRLSNLEVAKLLRLLEKLDAWTTNLIPPEKSERR